MKIDIKKAFGFAFSDEKWIIKFLIGGLLLMIPIVNFMVIGYLMHILKATSEGQEPVLPEWADWENLFKEGFMGFLIAVAYYVVLMIVSSIPILGCVILPVLLFLGAWISVATIRYLKSNDIKDAFDVKAIFEKIKPVFVDYIILALITSAVGFAGGIFFCLLCIPVFYACLFTTAAFGQLYYVTETTQSPESEPAPAEAESKPTTPAEPEGDETQQS